VDVPEAARHTSVTDGVRLAGLSLTVIECAAEEIALLAADHIHRSPEIGSAHLVRDVLQLADDLSALDLVENLTAELSVVALLVVGERSVADDCNPSVGCSDDVLEA